jgi:hypothetical protein
MNKHEESKCNDDLIKQDEERIQRDKERIKRDEERLARDEERLEHDKKKPHHFSLDGVKYDPSHAIIKGAEVRAKLPPEKKDYPIFLEEHGDKPDRQITDDETFSLEKHSLCFYSTPPATFGLL